MAPGLTFLRSDGDRMRFRARITWREGGRRRDTDRDIVARSLEDAVAERARLAQEMQENGTHVPLAAGEHELAAILREMIKRCHSPSHPDFYLYGARGIRVCDEWRFGPERSRRFAQHIGPRPSKAHSVDRIDNDRGYEPGNVRWATPKQQAANRRRCSVALDSEVSP